MKLSNSIQLVLATAAILATQAVWAGEPRMLLGPDDTVARQLRSLYDRRASLGGTEAQTWSEYVANKNNERLYKTTINSILGALRSQKNIDVDFASAISPLDKAVYLLGMVDERGNLKTSIPKADSKMKVTYYGAAAESSVPQTISFGIQPEGFIVSLKGNTIVEVHGNPPEPRLSTTSPRQLELHIPGFIGAIPLDLVDEGESKQAAEDAIRLFKSGKPMAGFGMFPVYGDPVVKTEARFIYQTPAEISSNTAAFIITQKLKRIAVDDANKLKAEDLNGARMISVGSLKALTEVVNKYNSLSNQASISAEAEMAQMLNSFKMDRCKI